jgi:hypothetical protein
MLSLYMLSRALIATFLNCKQFLHHTSTAIVSHPIVDFCAHIQENKSLGIDVKRRSAARIEVCWIVILRLIDPGGSTERASNRRHRP